MVRRIHSFVWGGLAAAIAIIIGIVNFTKSNNSTNLLAWIVFGVLAYTLISCLILDNNFVGDMVLEVFSWGFVKMPGLIFSLDLDGIIWLLTVKLIFWILGFILAALCGILAIGLGLVVSLFVYPFAIIKNIKGVE